MPRFWYSQSHLLRLLCLPLHLFLQSIVWLRRKWLSLRSYSSISVPVIVVGNINVGGTGKTPLIDYLVREFKARGYRPGIVSRGYGGKAIEYPLEVIASTPVSDCGDEAKLHLLRLGVPVVVDPNRQRACDWLAQQGKVDLIISDDGLQHYAMARDVEIVVLDGERGWGNGLLMPMGPLRESVSRLSSVDALVINNRFSESSGMALLERPLGQQLRSTPRYEMHFGQAQFVSLSDTSVAMSIEAMQQFSQNTSTRAIAGIGNPESFFSFLRTHGIQHQSQAFPDHYQYQSSDFTDPQQCLLMTEKDAVKCQQINLNNAWYLTFTPEVSKNLIHHCLQLLSRSHSCNELS